ncbi:MAG: hypothetical protein ABIH22_00185 [Candidatus Margulisiibacteriota bacterium]
MIFKKASEDQILETARKEGFKTLAENAMVLVVNGTTTVAEIMRVLPTKT